MSAEEEKEYWGRMVADLLSLKWMTAEKMAELVEAEPRQVWRWKAGEDRPKGMKAVRVYLLHIRHCPERQRPEGHSAAA